MRDADLEPTGRELKDPAATLVECVDPEGLKHTVISFDDAYKGHETLTTGVDLIMSFMAYPMVTGLVECNAADTKRARFAYPTGTIWTVKEVLRGFDQVGQVVGARAALELLYLGAMILHEAGETGPLQGCFSHGNLNPWRIGLKADGQVQIFGYGLAQVEMHHFVHGAGEHVGHDSIRYAPPERLEGQPEQPSSDSYSLAVMAYELITGKPLYDHKEPQKLWDAVKLAEGLQAVRTDKKLPKNLREMLVNALTYDPDKRLHGLELVEVVGGLLDDTKIEGRTLLEVMERMLNTGKKSSRKLVKASATSAFSMEALKAMAEAEEEDDVELDDSLPEERWGSVTREGTTGRGGRAAAKPARDRSRTRKRADAKKPAEDAKTTVATDGPRRRRKRQEAEPEVAEVAAAAETAPKEESQAEPEEPRRRRRKKSKSKEEVVSAAPEAEEQAKETAAAEPAVDAAPAADSDASPRRRRRKTSESVEPEVEAAAAEEPSPEADSPRRRRRRTATEEAPAEEASPRRRRRPKQDPKGVEASAEASTDEEPPPSPRRRRRPASEDKKAEDTTEDPPPAKRRRRRRKS